MADVELLPLPSEVRLAIRAYARACVEANLAPLQAENERLRAEVERLSADRDSWEQQASDRVADWHAEHLRAERLAEALRNFSGVLERLAFAIPAPNTHTPQLVELAIAMRAAALAQEDRNG